MRIRKGKRIPRTDGKIIEEFVGAVRTQTNSVSVARMVAPPGWVEPAQVPEFDEVVIVLQGDLTLVIDGRKERIGAGEVGLVERDRRVIYRNDGKRACSYYSVCAPAFHPALAHMEGGTSNPNQVDVTVAHRAGKALRGLLRRSTLRFLETLEVAGSEVSVRLVTDTEIAKLNAKWRDKPKPTDVLSFPAGTMPFGTPGALPLGDVVISLDTAKRQARVYERSVQDELSRYLAHGLLHLLGHDHEKPKDARRMAALEEQLLGSAGMLSG